MLSLYFCTPFLKAPIFRKFLLCPRVQELMTWAILRVFLLVILLCWCVPSWVSMLITLPTAPPILILFLEILLVSKKHKVKLPEGSDFSYFLLCISHSWIFYEYLYTVRTYLPARAQTPCEMELSLIYLSNVPHRKSGLLSQLGASELSTLNSLT